MCVDRGNGYEASRILVGSFEPQAGIRRMKEVAELMALQNKRCKNASETSLILLEIDRQRLIAEIGGQPPSDGTIANVLWMAMGPGTRSHIPAKLGATSAVEFKDMKEAIMKRTTLVGATSGGGFSRPTAMGVSSIASVTDMTQNPSAGEPPAADWAIDETGWPIDEEGNQIDGYIDGQLNFVKGKGKGKGECWNRGETGHRAAECVKPPSAGKGAYGYNGKGEGDGKGGKGKGKGECWNCGELGHRPYECKTTPEKGKGKGCGKENWQQEWQNGVHSICRLTEAKAKHDEEGFTAVKPEKAAKATESSLAPKNPNVGLSSSVEGK